MSYWSGDNLYCPVCHEIFEDPVLLPCSHSFCKACWQRWWRENPNHECPVCKIRSSMYDPPRNLALKNQCEAFSQERMGIFSHCYHTLSLNDAAADYRRKLRVLLRPLLENQKLLKDIKQNFDQTTIDTEVQAQDTERQIKDVFLMFEKFLKKEEKTRIAALNAEKQQKLQMMKTKSEALSRATAALSETMRATEEVLKVEDISFLLNYKTAAERVQRSVLDPPEQTPGALIDMEKHLKNLPFAVLDRIKEVISTTNDFLNLNIHFETLRCSTKSNYNPYQRTPTSTRPLSLALPRSETEVIRDPSNTASSIIVHDLFYRPPRI